MSRGAGLVMRGILDHLTGDWQELRQLACRAYDVAATARLTPAQLVAARRAVHRLQQLGRAETELRPMAGARLSRNGRPLGPRYLYARLSRDEQLRRAAVRTWEAAQRERELYKARRQNKDVGGRDTTTARGPRRPMSLETLAALLRGLQQFEAFVEDGGTHTILAPDGEQYSLWDIKHIYGRRVLLSCEEAVVIEVGLYHSAGDHAPDDPHIMRILRRLCDLAGVPCE